MKKSTLFASSNQFIIEGLSKKPTQVEGTYTGGYNFKIIISEDECSSLLVDTNGKRIKLVANFLPVSGKMVLTRNGIKKEEVIEGGHMDMSQLLLLPNILEYYLELNQSHLLGKDFLSWLNERIVSYCMVINDLYKKYLKSLEV